MKERRKAVSVAVTGSFAVGKSYVLDIVERIGYKTLSCDKIVNRLYQEESIQKTIIQNIKGIDNFDKCKLAEIIYNKQEERKKLEKIIYPLILLGIHNFLYKNKSEKYVFIEVPLLFESGFDKYFDYSVCVYCNENSRFNRAKEKKNFNMNFYQKIEKIQMSQKDKIQKADLIINTDLSNDELKSEILNIINHIK